MSRLFLIVATSLVTVLAPEFLLAQATSKANNDNEEPYIAGSACFEQLDFSCAIDLLTAAAYGTKPDRVERLADIYRKLAESHLALGQQQLAVEDFSKLLDIAPDFMISAPGTSPKILEALKEARRRLKKKSMPSSQSLESVTLEKRSRTQEVKPSNLSLGVGAQFLSGRDYRELDTGPVFSFELKYAYSHPWILGGGIRWSFHGVSSKDENIHTLSVWAGGGLSFYMGRIHIYGLICTGGGWFGISSSDSRWALVIPVRLGAQWQLSNAWKIGLGFTPSWILTFGDFLSSLTFDISATSTITF